MLTHQPFKCLLILGRECFCWCRGLMCRHLKSVRVFPLALRTRSGSQEFGGGQCSAEWNQKIEIYVAPFKLMQSLVLSFIFRWIWASTAEQLPLLSTVCLCRCNWYVNWYNMAEIPRQCKAWLVPMGMGPSLHMNLERVCLLSMTPWAKWGWTSFSLELARVALWVEKGTLYVSFLWLHPCNSCPIFNAF